MLESYLSLRKRVDRFIESVVARYGEQIACRARCTDCCRAGLTVCLVEAVAIGRSLGILDDMIHLQAGQPPRAEEGKCAFLDGDGLCGIYSDRPLVCRTFGLPLAVEGQEGITVCEKNFVYQDPHSSAVFDQKALDTALFATNLDYCSRAGVNPLARVALDRIAELALTTKSSE